MYIKYFKNGNFNIKLDRDEVQEIQENIARDYENEVTAILMRLDDIILADNCEGCAGNYNMYYAFYNCYTGCEYCPLDADFYAACDGKTVKFYGHKITDEELAEEYSEYFENLKKEDAV